MHLNDLDYIYKLKSNSFSRTEAGLQSHHDKSLEIEGKGFAYGWTSVWELGLGQSIHEWSLQTKAIWQLISAICPGCKFDPFLHMRLFSYGA